jgi:hypothetical protein
LPQEWEIDLEDLGNVYDRARGPTSNLKLMFDRLVCMKGERVREG